VRVLLIVPTVQPAIDTVPEIRSITSLHQVTVINGSVSIRELYQIAQRGNFDVIHFGTHGGTYQAEDILSLARVASASLVFLNACNTGKIASYLVAHGIPYAISTNVELADMEAWKVPLSFYEFLARQEQRGEVLNYPVAYSQADSGDGDYSFSVSVERITTLSAMSKRVLQLERRAWWVDWLIRIAVGAVGVSLLLDLWRVF